MPHRQRRLQAEQEAHQAYRNLLARLMSARKRYKLVADAWSLWVSLGTDQSATTVFDSGLETQLASR